MALRLCLTIVLTALICHGAYAQDDRYETLIVPAQESGDVNRPGLWSEYTLYSPTDDLINTNKAPIMFFLHGAGRRGTNPAQVRSLPPIATAINGEDFPFHIAAPQARPSRTWSEASVIDELEQFIDDVVELTDADPNRVYLAGQSMGGRGVWELLLSRPEYYAAAIPIAGDVSRKSRVSRLVDVPIWAFHGRNDNTVPIQGAINIIDRISNAGGEQASLTIYEDGGHSIWWRVFKQEPDLYDWMLSQSLQSVPEPTTAALIAPCLLIVLRSPRNHKGLK